MSPPEYRIVLNPQSKGNLGKSFFLEPLTYWLEQNKVGWTGADFDDRHKTFSKRHPEQVASYTLGNDLEAKDTLIRVLRKLLRGRPPVHIIDSRAQADALIIGALRELNFLELAKKEGFRLTFLLFPLDDNEAMSNVRELIELAAGQVDFLIVNNPAKNGSKLFAGSKMHEYLRGRGAGELTLPAVTPTTLQILEKIERKEGRGISFTEAVSNENLGLDPLVSGELSYFLNTVSQDVERVAKLIVPDGAKIEARRSTKVNAPRAPVTSGLNWASTEED